MNNLVNMEIIKIANILSSQKVLIIDDDDKIEKLLIYHERSLKITRCDVNDFRPITKNYNMYNEKFDHVICPKGLYSIKANNRGHILSCFVFAMNKQSKITFAIPDNRNYRAGREYETSSGKKFKMIDDGDYFKLVFRRELNSWFGKKEFWYKEILDYPLRIFQDWNDGDQDESLWKIDDLAAKKIEKFIVYSIDIIKN